MLISIFFSPIINIILGGSFVNSAWGPITAYAVNSSPLSRNYNGRDLDTSSIWGYTALKAASQAFEKSYFFLLSFPMRENKSGAETTTLIVIEPNLNPSRQLRSGSLGQEPSPISQKNIDF